MPYYIKLRFLFINNFEGEMQKSVLLVDDESSIRRSLSLSLNQEGYMVEPCENAVTAIKKLALYKKNHINLDTVVLDIRLPDIDGIKLGKIIKSQYPDSNIIFITGYSDSINSEDLENIASSHLLEKPFTINDLTAQIDNINNLTEHNLIEDYVEESEIKEKFEIKTFSAYALIKLNNNSDFISTYQKLYFDNNVLYCDATKGEYDIIMLLQGKSIDECRDFCYNKLRKMDSINEVDFLEVTNPLLDESLKSILNLFSIDSSNQPIRDSSNAVC